MAGFTSGMKILQMYSVKPKSVNLTKLQNGSEIFNTTRECMDYSRKTEKPWGHNATFYLHIINYIEDVEYYLHLNPCTIDCRTDERPFERAAPLVRYAKL